MKNMFAVIKKTEPLTVLRTCGTKEAAMIAAQMEKEKAPLSERAQITAVIMDDGGNADILF